MVIIFQNTTYDYELTNTIIPPTAYNTTKYRCIVIPNMIIFFLLNIIYAYIGKSCGLPHSLSCIVIYRLAVLLIK